MGFNRDCGTYGHGADGHALVLSSIGGFPVVCRCDWRWVGSGMKRTLNLPALSDGRHGAVRRENGVGVMWESFKLGWGIMVSSVTDSFEARKFLDEPGSDRRRRTYTWSILTASQKHRRTCRGRGERAISGFCLVMNRMSVFALDVRKLCLSYLGSCVFDSSSSVPIELRW